jgi:hypothetical protein
MLQRLRPIVLFAPLLLGGCAVGEGVAHVVKLIGNNDGGSASSPASVAPAAPAAAAVDDRYSPPPPSPAPRDEIKVESLPPRR